MHRAGRQQSLLPEQHNDRSRQHRASHRSHQWFQMYHRWLLLCCGRQSIIFNFRSAPLQIQHFYRVGQERIINII